jgi:hypothetical protein
VGEALLEAEAGDDAPRGAHEHVAQDVADRSAVVDHAVGEHGLDDAVNGEAGDLDPGLLERDLVGAEGELGDRGRQDGDAVAGPLEAADALAAALHPAVANLDEKLVGLGDDAAPSRDLAHAPDESNRRAIAERRGSHERRSGVARTVLRKLAVVLARLPARRRRGRGVSVLGGSRGAELPRLATSSCWRRRSRAASAQVSPKA